MNATDVPHTPREVSLQLFGWWELRCGAQTIALGRREQRLVALLALIGRQSRLQLAAALWPDSTEDRAMTSLRAAVWHTRHGAPGLLDAGRSTLALAPQVEVDVDRLTGLAAGAATSPAAVDLDDLKPVIGAGELLPGWYDDWVILERERLNQLRLHALELAAGVLTRHGQLDLALQLALEAVRAEPLRETANAVLMSVYLAEGNVSDAVRQYDRFRDLLRRELALEPSPALGRLLPKNVSAAHVAR